mmetsp:Transcript_13068/g.32278  ORF Transcript_13068/g.32278 Transcript_13068/m.32278 type:complete len:295 (+) Transcript_13068:39-923(+)|eukprot:CAMPEP_0198316896 /NCGR_PEP_ID=MMETSP1450-20131203/6609_1 /TAXON_ID=753684 ORGANISM="Madagascaria erythrocladiodes, Strain CCMP3234" /NCGR_SAMPLE_ID=MMETSP1450 /ASSEMBLY_ACC=CAM_ASM_001115 /LENGTH=294 /DNA_ID=CAMNT_0044020073 /DNA_START=38 /DNA_END=922 /DNA_ORIENTATION=-
MASDELFELRNYFVLGNYSAAITEGTSIRVEDEGLRIEKDAILARIAIAMGEPDKVIASVSEEDSPIAMQAVRLLALHSKDPAANIDMVKAALTAWMEDPVSSSNPTLLLVAALVYAGEGDYDAALKAAHKGATLEHLAAKVQILLKMDRVDVAKREAATMKRIDEDATLTQLANAWCYLAGGGSDVQEALFIYQDLLERHGATDPILNGIALSYLGAGRFDDAERTLQEALAKNPKNPDTLVNVIACAMHKQKPAELVERYIAQLRTVAPAHPWLAKLDSFEAEFARVAATYA